MSYAIPLDLSGTPGWQVSSNRRMKMSLVVATVLVIAILNLFRMPVAGEPVPLFELVVRLIEQAVEEEVVAPEESTPVVQEAVVPEPVTEPLETSEVAPVPQELISVIPELQENLPEIPVVEDWQEFGTEVVREFIANLPKEFTVNPVMDEKRRLAAIKFPRSGAPQKQYAWDNVEKDQIGRTILNLGNGCFRVLDDPSAVYRDVFETYTQFVAQCTFAFGKRKPRNLPWVEKIHAKFAYLRLREAQKRDPDAF